MRMAGIAVHGELLRWARDRSRVPGPMLRKAFPRLDAWEKGQSQPTLRQLELFARKTMTPLGYLFLQQPPDDSLPIPDLRTVKDAKVRRPSPNLLETVCAMLRRQDWMHDFLEEEGAPQLEFVGSARLSERPVDVAARIRQTLGLAVDWAREYPTWERALRGLRTAAESAGILVVINGVLGNNTSRKLDPDEFRGFALADPCAPLVFVNGADFKAAQMFTLAHELVHLWLDRTGVSELAKLQPGDNDVERFCNAAGAEFLVPRETMVHAWPAAYRGNQDPFRALARRFKVSEIVVARRAQDLAFISRQDFFRFLAAHAKQERRRAAAKPRRGDFYANQDARVGRRFTQAVVAAAREGRLLYSDAYRLTGLYGSTLDKYAQRIGLGDRA